MLISCIDFDIIRQNFYTPNLKDLFHNIHPKRIISFIHAIIGLTNKLKTSSGMIQPLLVGSERTATTTMAL